MRAEKEVVSVYASALVTAMADVHAGRNRAVLDLPGPAMGELRASKV
jgi:hypothetical protein